MNFLKYLSKEKQDVKRAVMLGLVVFAFCILINKDIVAFISNLGEVPNPFYTNIFKVNIFNFDPSLYYVYSQPAIIHPFFSFFAQGIGEFAIGFGQNYTVLIINSALIAVEVGLLFIFARKQNVNKNIAALISLMYGVTTYSLISAFMPDSYAYAQFFIVVSIIYIFYMKQENLYSIVGVAVLAVCNFGVTITNVIPYSISILFNKTNEKWNSFIKKIVYSIGIFAGIVIVLTVIQFLKNNGATWISNCFSTINSGGVAYASKFNIAEHSKILRFMIASPILFPDVTLLDAGLMSVVTDISKQLTIVDKSILFVLLVTVIVSLIRNVKSSTMYMLITYIMWNIILHVGIGIGLAAFEYDMFLYAGHYLVVIFMIIVLAFKDIKDNRLNNAISIILLILVVCIALNNIQGMNGLVNLLREIY